MKDFSAIVKKCKEMLATDTEGTRLWLLMHNDYKDALASLVLLMLDQYEAIKASLEEIDNQVFDTDDLPF
jgi:hypothetical protein